MPPILFPLSGPNVCPASQSRRGVPPSVRGRIPLPISYFRIGGVTKDSLGAALANCTVNLYRTTDNVWIDSAVSDASGLYEFRSTSPPIAWYVVAYKVTGPGDLSGTTLNTMVSA